MLKNENIICISSIDWDFIWQQHQAIMSRLAKNGNKILFIENTGVRSPKISDVPRIKKRFINWLKSAKGFRKEAENLYIYSPLILPFPYWRVARWINRYLLTKALNRWIKAFGFYDPVLWTFLPTPIVLDLAEAIPHKSFVYYCTDNFAATSLYAKRIARYEEMVLKAADIIFVMSKNMAQKFSVFNKQITCVPMGVDTDRFLNTGVVLSKPCEIEGVKTPIIGYIGGVRDSIDQELVVFLAKQLPDFTFIFVGPAQTDIMRMEKYKNIVFTGQKSHNELSCYIKYFNACIIPYKKDDYTDSISPAKLNEYLIMGKPVISTRLDEIDSFNKESGGILYIADNYQEFLNYIIKAIKDDSEALKNKRVEIAKNNSWDKKLESMSNIIEASINDKETKKDLNWQKRFLGMYKDVRNKGLRLVFGLFLVWLVVFHSPLVWFLASPLRISKAPEKADVIVVFGGGVGETGSPGKSTIERARYAVKLYKDRYSDRIIFSSGYTYIYNDAENMRLFAISMGVPERDIILEEKANSVYENVIFSKELLDKNKWRSILLISSPYNMRRAELVFSKLAKDIKVTYVPVDEAQFYDRTAGIRFEQIKAIIHEYLGIIYYLVKGYI